jgi:hypothetical protein
VHHENPSKTSDVRADLNLAIATLAATGDAGLLRIADALSLWLAGETVSLESALGVASTWRSQTRRRRRDGIYAEIAGTLFPALIGRPLAKAIIEAIARYQSAAWLRDWKSDARPNGANALLYDLLSLDEHLLEIDALRRLLKSPGIFSSLESPEDGVRLKLRRGRKRR